MSKRAIIYVRVSTDEQAEKGYSLPTQLDACRKYAAENGLTVFAEFREDYSGAKLERPELDKLRVMLKQRRADAVICYSVDRLSRNPSHAWELAETWHRAEVELHFCNRGRTDDTPEGHMTFGFESLFAYYYRAKTMEATRRGKDAKAKSGKWVGAGFTPYGYNRVGRGTEARLVIDEQEIAVVKRIFSLYTDRTNPLKLRTIAHLLTTEGVRSPGRGKGVGKGWYASTVKKIISNLAYVGEFKYNGYAINLPALAAIDRETYTLAQDFREQNKRLSRRNRKTQFLLSGFFRCTCGSSMCGQTVNRKSGLRHYYYRCAIRSHYQYMRSCVEPHIRGDLADELAWDWLSGLFKDPSKLHSGLDDLEQRKITELEPNRERLSVLNDLIDKAGRRMKRAAALAEDAVDDELAAEYHANAKAKAKLKADLSKERDMLIASLAQIDLTKERRIQIESWAEEIRVGLAEGDVSYETKRTLLNWLKVAVKVEYREEVRGLFLQCELRYGDDWRPLPIGYSSWA